MEVFERVKMLIIENVLFKINNTLLGDENNRDEDLYSAVCEAVFLAFDAGKNDTNESVFSNEVSAVNKDKIIFTVTRRNFYNQERMTIDFGVPALNMEDAIKKAERQRELAEIHTVQQFGAVKLKITEDKQFKILDIVWLDHLE